MNLVAKTFVLVAALAVRPISRTDARGAYEWVRPTDGVVVKMKGSSPLWSREKETRSHFGFR